jgi:hypothetical protein
MKTFIEKVFKMKKLKEDQATEAVVDTIIEEVKEEVKKEKAKKEDTKPGIRMFPDNAK